MKWYNYVACFFAGVFLIHILPHALNGPSLVNILGITVSLIGGGLLLWAGRFSFKNIWKIVLVAAGMAAVLLFTGLHPHHRDAQQRTHSDPRSRYNVRVIA
jgi:protein-S-isoprenylcysteine O-methyltransferase Ste14